MSAGKAAYCFVIQEESFSKLERKPDKLLWKNYRTRSYCSADILPA